LANADEFVGPAKDLVVAESCPN